MKRRNKWFKSITFLFFLLFLFWVVLQFIAPFALPSGSVSDLSGLVGISDNDDVIHTMSAPWNAMYSLGDRLCHQKADRSLFFNGNEMPFCARCTAIWLGIALGLGFMVLYSIELNEKFLVAIILGLVPIGIDGVGQLFGLWESTNLVRFMTGLLAGGVCGVAIGVIIDEVRTIRIHKK
jgi:uncharacterized membrane protein